MPTGLGALGDDDVDAVLLVLQGVTGTARERGDRDATLVGSLHDRRGRRPERVDEQRDRVLERDVHLREPRGVGPAEQVVRVRVLGQGRDVVLGQHLLDEVAILLRDHRLELALELHGVTVRPPCLFEQRGRHHEIDPVRAAVHVLVDPVELDLELLGREVQRAEHSHAAGLADRGHDVAAVAEGEDRELDAEAVANGRVHGPECSWNVF